MVHFFKRKHIKLLPTGQDIYRVIERYLELDPQMQFVILDEDFLLNRKRAMELRDAVLSGGKAVSIFVFSSIRAISEPSGSATGRYPPDSRSAPRQP